MFIAARVAAAVNLGSTNYNLPKQLPPFQLLIVCVVELLCLWSQQVLLWRLLLLLVVSTSLCSFVSKFATRLLYVRKSRAAAKN